MFLKKIVFIFMILVMSVFCSENAKSVGAYNGVNTTKFIGVVGLIDNGAECPINIISAQLDKKLFVCAKNKYQYLYNDEDCSDIFSSLGSESVPSGSGFTGYFIGNNTDDMQVIDASGNLAVSVNKFMPDFFCAKLGTNIGFNSGSYTCKCLRAKYEELQDGFARIMFNSNYDLTKTPQESAKPSTVYLKYGSNGKGSGLYTEQSEADDKKFESLDTTPKAKAGYKFKGFYTQQNGAGTRIINDEGTLIKKSISTLTNNLASSSGNITLYADWVTSIYKITLNKNGGTGGTDYLYAVPGYGAYMDEYGSVKAGNVELPTREGYKFNGFYYTGISDPVIGVFGYEEVDGEIEEGSVYSGNGAVKETLDDKAAVATGDFSVTAQWTQCAKDQYVVNNECTDCGVGNYIYNGKCLSCPNIKDGEGNDLIGNDTLYKFVASSTNKGVTTCEIQLNVDTNATSKSACGDGTDVRYAYSSVAGGGKYTRKQNYTVVAGAQSIELDVSKLTKIENANDLTNDYCEHCANNTYNVNGVCGVCRGDKDKNIGYCLQSGSCIPCPAGYDCSEANKSKSNANGWECPSAGLLYRCGKDTYAEEGYYKCVACNIGYSTAGRDDDICLDKVKGEGCKSYKACVAMPEKICFTSDLCIDSGNDKYQNIKFGSVNMSVVKVDKKNNN